MWRILLQQNQTYRSLHARMGGHPTWVIRAAVTITLLVIVIPMIAIVCIGLLIGMCVFFVLSLIAKVMDLLGLSAPGPATSTMEPELRRNVRVVEEDGV